MNNEKRNNSGITDFIVRRRIQFHSNLESFTTHSKSKPLGKLSWWTNDTIFWRVAVITFLIQAAFLLNLSHLLYSRFDLTWDFSTYYQPYYWIAHGHLNPITSVSGFRSHFFPNTLSDWIMVPLALTYFIYPHGLTLLIIQDIGTVGTEIIALLLIRDLIIRRLDAGHVGLNWVQWLGLLLLVGNPWVYGSALFDFHLHTLESLFITGAAWQFYRRHTAFGYIFVVLCAITADVSVSYLVPLGLMLIIWKQKRDGIIVFVMGIVGFILDTRVFGINPISLPLSKSAPSIRPVAPLEEISRILHSLMSFVISAMNLLLQNGLNVYARIGPSGFLGVLSPFGLFIPFLIFLETALAGGGLTSVPGTQSDSAYAFLSIGTIAILLFIASRRPIAGKVIGLLLSVNLVMWAFIDGPALWKSTAIPAASTAATLAKLRATIPQNAEVVTGQGIMGRFAARSYVYGFSFVSDPIPIHAKLVYFIITPYASINESSTVEELARITYLSKQPGMELVADSNGVWAFKWRVPTGVSSFALKTDTNSVPAWSLESPVGTHILKGKITSWHLQSLPGSVGYVESGAYWRLSRGTYRLTISMSTSTPVNVEVWNATANALLSRHIVPTTPERSNLSWNFHITSEVPIRIDKGWGPFSFQPIVSHNHNQFEVRVWSNGKGTSNIYSIGIAKISGLQTSRIS